MFFGGGLDVLDMVANMMANMVADHVSHTMWLTWV
jgi:hypothetical protein